MSTSTRSAQDADVRTSGSGRGRRRGPFAPKERAPISLGPLSIALFVVVGLLVALPILQLFLRSTGGDDPVQVWRDVFSSRISSNLFWTPLRNTLGIGVAVSILSTVMGALTAYLVVMTDVPLRKTIGLFASIPFVLPSFALALAWQTVFRNDLIGGQVGVLMEAGIPVPDWLAWGAIPTVATLTGHYYSLSFALVAAALVSVNADLVEAAEVAGASRWQTLLGIVMPVVRPALVASALLGFAQGVSNFASPAILGLPVRFQTLSTRLYGAIQTGQQERGYALAILLLIIAGTILLMSNRLGGGRRSFSTISGKGSRRVTISLGRWRWAAFAGAAVVATATTILPALVLVASSLSRRGASLTGGFDLHYWIGKSNPDIAQGQAGVLRNPLVVDAAFTTLKLGLMVAVGGLILGLLVGYVTARGRGKVVAGIATFSYLPFLIPGIALGAAYISLYGRQLGPFPSLYGTLGLLVAAGIAATLPFAVQAGRAAVTQVSKDLEEAAVVAGAGFWRRLFEIVLPLISRGLLAGVVLVFVKMVRDLSLVILLATPTTTVLSVITFQYASEGFVQFANAITVIIATISIAVTILARRLEGASQPWAR